MLNFRLGFKDKVMNLYKSVELLYKKVITSYSVFLVLDLVRLFVRLFQFHT